MLNNYYETLFSVIKSLLCSYKMKEIIIIPSHTMPLTDFSKRIWLLYRVSAVLLPFKVNLFSRLSYKIYKSIMFGSILNIYDLLNLYLSLTAEYLKISEKMTKLFSEIFFLKLIRFRTPSFSAIHSLRTFIACLNWFNNIFCFHSYSKIR